MNRNNRPAFTATTIKDMEDMTFFTHALIFDDLLIVAQKETNCFVYKTSEGLILIDAIWPAKEVYDAIITAIKEVGWNPEDLKKLVLTHGHVDHTGCGRYFVENFHVETYLSEIDTKYWEEHPTKPDRPETWKDYEITNFIKDKDTITLGDKTIYAFATPGHTPGCMSFLFPVTEDGETHMAGLFGGATPPWAGPGTEDYLKSLDYFLKESKDKKADVALANHTAMDYGQERIAYARRRPSYLPNIYILGEEGYQKFCQMYRMLGEEKLNQKN